MFKQKGKSGFTLLELLIVVIIVSILATVALPQFGRMTRRARTSEATNMIGAILTAEALYYSENRTFINFADNAAAATAGLLVDVPLDANTNFDYAGTGASTSSVTVTGSGDATATSGIVVTGTVRDDGSRAIASN